MQNIVKSLNPDMNQVWLPLTLLYFPLSPAIVVMISHSGYMASTIKTHDGNI